jgi:hypothetical protein
VSPESFNFKVTVPGDDRLVGVVRDLCAHTASYAQLAESAGKAFCDRVVVAATEAVEKGAGAPCPMAFDCSGGELRVTVAGQTIIQPLTV